MGQSKIYSWFETLLNIAIGFVVAMIGQMIIFPIVGLEVHLNQNLWIASFFTCVGIVRMYVVRRFFNWLHTRGWN